MAWNQAFPLLMSLLAAGADAAFRNRTCMVDAKYSPSEKVNTTYMGVETPFKIGHFTWASGWLEGQLLRILFEEQLGINSELSMGLATSAYGFRAISGCLNPTSVPPPDGNLDCNYEGVPELFILPEVWHDYASGAMAYIRANFEEKYPILASPEGYMGFAGRDGIFIRNSTRYPAFHTYHYPLEYYFTYQNPAVNISEFYDSPWSIDINLLQECGAENFDGMAEGYFAQTGDTAAIMVNTSGDTPVYKVKCDYNNRWLLSPKCRSDMSQCIPFITASVGWYAGVIMQKAFAWDMPIAVATTTSYGLYTQIPTIHRVMQYWWFPDSTFMSIGPTELIWPPHNAAEWAAGNTRTDAGDGLTYKFLHFQATNSTNANMGRALQLFGKFSLWYEGIYDLLVEYVARGNTADNSEALACDWLNRPVNKQIWENWIPKESECQLGQGMILPSGEFTDTRTADTRCEWCSVGKKSEVYSDTIGRTYKCTDCGTGEFQAFKGRSECTLCANGQTPTAARSSCMPCEVGTYSIGGGLCGRCRDTYTTQNPGSLSQTDCVCVEGAYRSHDPEERLGHCLQCPLGMTCAVGSDALGVTNPENYTIVPLLQAGYWSSREQPFSVFRCSSKDRCPGDARPGEGCARNLETRACSICREGYRWVGEFCQACPERAVALLAFPLLPLILIFIVILVLYRFGADPYLKWGSWQNGIAAVLFILLTHYQIVNLLSGVNVMFPSGVQQLLSAFEFTSDVMSVLTVSCVGLRSFKDLMILRSTAPLILAACYLVTFGLSRLVGLQFPRLKMNVNRTLNGFFSLVFTFFIAIVVNCFIMFKCGPNPNRTQSLLKDRSVVCYEGEWVELSAVSIISVLLWVVGMGGLFVYAVVTAPAHFHDEGVQMRWKFLFIRFRPDVHWWSIVFAVKGIVLNSGFLFIASGLGQILWILSILMIYCGFEFVYRPWRHIINNSLDLWAHLNLTMACGAAIYFAWEDNEDLKDLTESASTYMLWSLFGIAIPCAPTAFVMWYAQTSPGSMMKKRVELVLILDSFEKVSQINEAEMREILASLDESDLYFMMQAKDILQTEFAKRKCRSGYSSHKLSRVPLGAIKEVRKTKALGRPTDTVIQKNGVQVMQTVDL